MWAGPATYLVLKECIAEFMPTITDIVNMSLRDSLLPKSLKTALIRPFLKKTGLDSDILRCAEGQYDEVCVCVCSRRLCVSMIWGRGIVRSELDHGAMDVCFPVIISHFQTMRKFVGPGFDLTSPLLWTTVPVIHWEHITGLPKKE